MEMLSPLFLPAMNPAIMASLTALQPHAKFLSLMGTVLGVAIGSTAAVSYSYFTLRMTAEAQQHAAELLNRPLQLFHPSFLIPFGKSVVGGPPIDWVSWGSKSE